ncbi:MAG: hypothetical protein RBR75_01790 [Acholeplasmataceae bacterium]|jgi:hypothetical protein|nr:hypothetical protein [Acholeplasmataceae bacterium]
MRKLFALITVFLLVLGLTACADTNPGEFPTFDEDKVVELSAQEMIELFENIDYTSVDSESVQITTQGHVYVIDESDPMNSFSTWRDETRIDIDAVLFFLMSEDIDEVKGHAEGTLDLYQKNEYDDEWSDPEVDITEVDGEMGIYFTGGYLYMMVDGNHAEDGTDPEAVSFKQKLNQQVTQAMLDEAMGEVNPEDQIDEMVPQELLDMLENGDFDEIMDAIPNLKVYQDGTTFSIVFSITKQIALQSIEDIIVAYAEVMGEEITQAQIDEMVEEAEDQINAVIDELEFTYVISITGTRVTQVAEMLVFKSVDENIDINLTTVIDFGVDTPDFPTDLDTYEAVDEPGEGVFD